MRLLRFLPLLAHGLAAYSPDNQDDWLLLKPQESSPPGSYSTLPFQFGIVASDYNFADTGNLVRWNAAGAELQKGVADSKSGGADVSLVPQDEEGPETNAAEVNGSHGKAPASGTVSPYGSHSVHGRATVSKGEVSEVAVAHDAMISVACNNDKVLQLSLKDGILTLTGDRIGSIVSSHQFQFDGPVPQHGALYAAGWLVTHDGTLCLGDSNLFYKCASGDFYKLYDQSIGSQCVAVQLDVIELISC